MPVDLIDGQGVLVVSVRRLAADGIQPGIGWSSTAMMDWWRRTRNAQVAEGEEPPYREGEQGWDPARRYLDDR